MIQFIKGRWKTGESKIAGAARARLRAVRMGMGFTIERLRDPRIPMDEHEEAAAGGLRARARGRAAGSTTW